VITRLLRLNHWRARARYWRKQADLAKREVARLHLSLVAERYRNMQREDTFASAAFLGHRNMWGLAPRTGPAATEEVKKAPALPYQWTGADLMEFETFWKPDAEAAGISLAEARRQFEQQVITPRRIPLNDEFGAN